jgi:hypothetical protein
MAITSSLLNNFIAIMSSSNIFVTIMSPSNNFVPIMSSSHHPLSVLNLILIYFICHNAYILTTFILSANSNFFVHILYYILERILFLISQLASRTK